MLYVAFWCCTQTAFKPNLQGIDSETWWKANAQNITAVEKALGNCFTGAYGSFGCKLRRQQHTHLMTADDPASAFMSWSTAPMFQMAD